MTTIIASNDCSMEVDGQGSQNNEGIIMVKDVDTKVGHTTQPSATLFKDKRGGDTIYDLEVPDQGTQKNDLPIQNPPSPLAANDPMDEKFQLANPMEPIVDLTKANQEREFHTPIQGESQVNIEGGINATIGSDEPSKREFDVMIDVVTLYTHTRGSDHGVEPVGKVDEEIQNNNTVDPILPPPVANAENEKDPKVFDTSRIAFDPSQVVATASAIADKTSTLVDDPKADTAEPNAAIPLLTPP